MPTEGSAHDVLRSRIYRAAGISAEPAELALAGSGLSPEHYVEGRFGAEGFPYTAMVSLTPSLPGRTSEIGQEFR